MNIDLPENVISEQEFNNNPNLSMVVNKDSELKTFLVEYVGKKLNVEEVTVQMIAEVLALDFAEFTYSFAEENFIRGYQTGLEDAGLYHREE